MKAIFSKKNNKYFFTLLFVLLLVIFRKAFLMNYFLDDYFFLKISDASNVGEFLNFFSPIRTYSYKPLAAEVFYFIIHLLNNNAFLAHVIVFAVYFLGLYYLYKSLVLLTKSEILSKLTVFLYSISFTHVFHLYYLGTFQETALFTCLSLAFYFFMTKREPFGILFYVLALLTKETAILYFPFLIIFLFIYQRKRLKPNLLLLLGYFGISLIFYFLYSIGLKHVTGLDQYRLHLDLKFIANNFIWYFIWALGGPNFLPDYFRSIFGPPIAEFWEVVKDEGVLAYFGILGLYLLTFAISLVTYLFKKAEDIKAVTLNLLMAVGGFFIFIGPILLFTHQWMLRLMLPLIFLSLFQAYILFKLVSQRGVFQKLGVSLIILYAAANFLGIRVHESSSTYILENQIFKNSQEYFNKHRDVILQHDIIYFRDLDTDLPKGWGGSEKLKNSLNDDNFLYYFFSEKKMSAVYGYENKTVPPDAYVIDSEILLDLE